MRVTKLMLAAALVAVVAIAGPWLSKSAARTKGDDDTSKRLNAAADVLSEVLAAPDKGIPQDLLDKAACVVIVPNVKKGAFILGAKYGRGFIVCRKKSGRNWSAPGGVKVEGGSVGFQIGGSETDVIMLVMNESSIDKLLSSKFTIGADASVAAGPLRRMFSFMPRFSRTRDRADCSPASRLRARRCGLTMMQIKTCTANRCRTKISCSGT